MTGASTVSTDARPVFGARVRVALVREHGPRYRKAIRQASDVYTMFREEAEQLDREQFWAVYLDGKNRVLCVNVVSVGTLTAALAHPREVFKPAILANAAALALVHNHPSGDPEPSADDLALTERLRNAADILGIRILDHVVIGDGSYRSLTEEGKL